MKFIVVSVIFSLLALAQGVEKFSDPCQQFTFDLCNVEEELIVGQFELPIIGSDVAIQSCQELCQIEPTCKLFLFDAKTNLCQLLSSWNFRKQCEQVTGPFSPAIFTCIPDEVLPREPVCIDFTRINCQYDYQPVLSALVPSDSSCQSFAEDEMVEHGGNAFRHDRTGELGKCDLVELKEFDCTGIIGPDFPDINNCLALE